MRFTTWRLLVIVLALSVPAYAQGVQTSSIIGTVRDSSGAVVPRANVMIESTSLVGGPINTETEPRGVYRFSLLPPGEYTVTARQPGFASPVRRGVALVVGATLTVDLTLRPAGLVAEIEVSDPVSLVDVRNAGASTRINLRSLENLPSKRTLAELINLAPGVAAQVGFGGTQNSNAFYVDGVETSDPSVGSSPYLRFNQNWLQQVEIAALGAPLEFSRTTGVSVNAILRSGSNRVSGLLEALTTSPSWLARNTRSLSQQLQTNFAPLQLIRWWDTSGQLGGPVVRDRLWYFGGFEGFVHERRPAGYSGPGTQTVTDNRSVLKLTASLRPSLHADGFIQQGFYTNSSEDLSAQTPPDATVDSPQPQTAWQSHLTWTHSNSTYIEARSGGFRSDGHYEPHPPATREGPARRFDEATGIVSGSSWTVGDFNRFRETTAAVVTHYRDGWLGRHQFHGGVEHEYAWMQTWSGPATGMSFTDNAGIPIRVSVSLGDTVEAWTHRTSIFVADRWEIGNVSLSPGFRVDANRGSVPLIRNVYRTTPVAPSLGIAWDVRENHTVAVRAHVGSSFDQVFLGRVSTIDLSHRNPNTEYNISPTGEWTIRSFRPAPTTTNTTVSPDIDASRVDQLMGSVEWQVRRDFSAEANIVYRRFRDMVGIYEVGLQWRPVQAQDPGPDNLLGTADDGEFLTAYAYVSGNTAFVYGNVPDAAVRNYRALQLVGRKRFADGWQAQISYTWPHTWGTVSNLALTNSGVNDLGPGGGYSNPNNFINNEGIAAFDPREFKILADASLRYLGGITVGAVYRYYTGQTWARRATLRFEDNVQFVYVEPRGTHQLPAINNLDLRFEKTIPVRGLRLGVSADIFNVTNQGVPNSASAFPNPINFNSGPSFGVPGAWVDPRLLRLGIRLTF